jgi:serine/threonine protein kinase
MTMRLPSIEVFEGQSLGKASHDISFSTHMLMGFGSSENDCFRNVVQLLFPPTVYLCSTHMLSTRVHRVYQLKLSNGHQLTVKFSPPPAIQLLRRERISLETEVRALTILARINHPCIPRLYRYIPHDASSGVSFLVRQYIGGIPLAEVQNRLSTKDLNDLDRHLGSLIKVIGQQVSTAFGPLTKVAAGTGSYHWREAFVALFEEVLRDAEDMFIHLPYSQIRREMYRWCFALDEIQTPRLVVVNLGRPSEVLLDPETGKLSGLLDFGSALWGDVMLAEIFESPSDAFLAEFGPIPSSDQSQFIRSML